VSHLCFQDIASLIHAPPSGPRAALTDQVIAPEPHPEDSDDGIEFLSERVRRMEINSFEYFSGLGASEGGRFGGRVTRLKEECGAPSRPICPPGAEPDFVSTHVLTDMHPY
jgi:hypothetical protein